MPKWSCGRCLFLMVSVLLLGHLPTHAGAEGPHALRAEDIPISVLKGMEEEDPVIAWDGNHYLVVWQSNRKDPEDYNVYGARVSPAGRLLDSQGLAISTAPSNQIFIDVAWGKGLYLAVWQDLRSRQRWEIYGARLRSDGTVLDHQGIPFAVGERNARHPQIASDGKEFLVVWMEENEGKGWDVSGVRVSAQGKRLDQERILIAQALGDQAHPAVAWGEGSYLVVWMDHPPGETPRISGRRVAPSGKLLDPGGVVLSSAFGDPGYPAVAWGKGQFVVVWADHPAPSVHTLSGVLAGFSGKGVDVDDFLVAQGSNFKTFPSIKCRGKDCFVVWEEDQSEGRPMRGIEDIIRDVRGAFLDLSRNPVRPKEVMVAPRAIGNHFAKVASDGRGYLVVWKDYRTGTAASLGRLLTSSR